MDNEKNALEQNEHYQLGRQSLAEEKPLDAAHYFYLALKKHPQHKDLWVELARITYNLHAYPGHRDYDDIISYYETALALDGMDSEVWNELGKIHLELNHFDAALTAFQKAIAIQPETGAYHTNIAETYYKTGQYDQSHRHAEKAVETDPEEMQACYVLGLNYAHLGHYPEAIGFFNKAIALSTGKKSHQIASQFGNIVYDGPDHDHIVFALGETYYKMKDYERSIENFRFIIDELDSGYVEEAMYNLGLVYQELQQYEQAIKQYSELIAANEHTINHLEDIATTALEQTYIAGYRAISEKSALRIAECTAKLNAAK